MFRADDIPMTSQLHGDPNYALLAAESIRERLEQFVQEIDGVRHRAKEDIEHVHRMRVASRRLRACFALFEACLPAPDFAKWTKPLRRITKQLGAARDVDVQIDFLNGFLKEFAGKSHRQGIERLLLRLGQRRETLQAGVLKALDKLEKSKLLAELEQMVLQLRVQANLKDAQINATPVRVRARELIVARLENMLVFEPYVEQEEKGEELHQMRIATKRLRYAMEIFNPAFDGRLKEFIEPAKKVQALLGDLQDCEVWSAFMREFEDEERRRTQEFFGHVRPMGRVIPGLHFLARNRTERRKEIYAQFVAFWLELNLAQTWRRLLAGLEELAQSPAPQP
ncbi:MAG: CHAD domain-containing protein [Planctomycetota bacterium]|nr:CHAD domain-containing protein [Planctomycetota bacterium]